MTPSLRLINTDLANLVGQVDMFRHAIENIDKGVEDDVGRPVPGALLNWNSGPFREGHVIVHWKPFHSIVQILETRDPSVGDIQLEMAWPTRQIQSDPAVISRIAYRMVAHATHIAADAHRDWTDPEWLHHRAALVDLHDKALKANAAFYSPVESMISAHAATPWSSAWVKLQDSYHDLDAPKGMVDVEVIRNQQCSILSMMPHVLMIDVKPKRNES